MIKVLHIRSFLYRIMYKKHCMISIIIYMKLNKDDVLVEPNLKLRLVVQSCQRYMI